MFVTPKVKSECFNSFTPFQSHLTPALDNH